MKKTLAILLLLPFLLNCKMTPTLAHAIVDLGKHGAKETISAHTNPRQTHIYVQGQSRSKRARPRATKRRTVKADPYLRDNSPIGEWIPPPPSYICARYEDFNGDGYVGKDELIGLKNYFEAQNLGQDYLLLGSTWYNVEGKRIASVVRNTETRKILQVEEYVMPSFAGSRRTTFRLNKNARGIKEYSVEWKVNGKKIPTRTREFVIDHGE